MKFLLLIILIFSVLATSVRGDENNTPLTELFDILETEWLYPLDKDAVRRCAANEHIVTIPECFVEKDLYMYRYHNTTVANAAFLLETIPSGIDGALFGSITMTNNIPNDKGMDMYLLPYLQRMRNEGIEAFLINMNKNRGGFVSGIAAFLRYFVSVPDDNEKLLFEMQRRNRKPERHIAVRSGVAANACVAVLVNKETISAPETITHALQQMGAYVVGEITAKKGVAQKPYTLRDGAIIMFTSGRIHFPDGSTIDGIGVIPDYITSNPHTQREKAMAYLRRCYAEKQAARNRLPELTVSAHP